MRYVAGSHVEINHLSIYLYNNVYYYIGAVRL